MVRASSRSGGGEGWVRFSCLFRISGQAVTERQMKKVSPHDSSSSSEISGSPEHSGRGQRFTRRERLLMALCVMLGFFILLGGRALPEVSAREKSASGTLFDELKVFTDVLAIVQRDYVRQ